MVRYGSALCLGALQFVAAVVSCPHYGETLRSIRRITLAPFDCGHPAGNFTPGAGGQSPASAPPAARTVLMRAAQIIDGCGGPPIQNGAVLIRGDRIERLGPAAGLKVDTVIDLGAATILPGLIDLHTHLTDEVGTNWESALLTTTPGRAAIYGVVNARTTLLAGLTSVRDMGPTWPYVDVDLRYAIDKGSGAGPRLQVAGNYVSATGGAGDARQRSTGCLWSAPRAPSVEVEEPLRFGAFTVRAF